MELTSQPQLGIIWREVLGNIPHGKAAVFHYDRHWKAEHARSNALVIAKRLGLRLHTQVKGGVYNRTFGHYEDIDSDVTLTVWF